jgi:transcriptional regulator with XRE-family HTH domain
VNYKDNPDFCKAFGERVKQLRESKGLSMRQLAATADMDHTQIFRIEHGVVNTTISMVLALSEGLQIPHYELFNFPFPDTTRVKSKD